MPRVIPIEQDGTQHRVESLVPGSLKASVLSIAAAAEPSRLSCQIMMRDELGGLIVLMPQGQH